MANVAGLTSTSTRSVVQQCGGLPVTGSVKGRITDWTGERLTGTWRTQDTVLTWTVDHWWHWMLARSTVQWQVAWQYLNDRHHTTLDRKSYIAHTQDDFTFWISLSLSLNSVQRLTWCPSFGLSPKFGLAEQKMVLKSNRKYPYCWFLIDSQDTHFIFPVLRFTKHCTETHTG